MSEKARTAYAELIERAKNLALLRSCGSLLGWDQRTYMPPSGAAHRAEQSRLMAGLAHGMATDPRVTELLDEIEGSGLLDDPQSVEAVNVRELRRGHTIARKLPRAFVEEFSKTSSEAYSVWVEARRNGDFPSFQPWLEKLVDLNRQKAALLGWEKTPYDALLDLYEPGMTTQEVQALFTPLEKELSELIGKIAASGKTANASILENDYPADAQAALCRSAAEAIGFDFNAGRLDETIHPFCSGIGPGDTRLTTRYHPRHFTHALFGTLHEAGHGLYHKGLDPKHYGTPRGQSVSLGIHESQSRLWENFVGRSRAFWAFFLPKAASAFPGALGGAAVDDLFLAVNETKPSFIRVEADEATYNLHIILRFRLEIALIEGGLKAADVPGAWNEGFKKLFGLDVPGNRQGCLQDVHWSNGAFGYFPTYTLGNLYAAQFFVQARKELGDLDAAFSKGRFAPLLAWLREKIHRPGMKYRAGDLCETVTGKPLSHRPLMDHLRTKLGGLYGV